MQNSDEARYGLAKGVPAILAIGSGILFTVLIATHRNLDLKWCETRAAESVLAGDYHTAQICYARWLQAHPDDELARQALELCTEKIAQSHQ